MPINKQQRPTKGPNADRLNEEIMLSRQQHS